MDNTLRISLSGLIIRASNIYSPVQIQLEIKLQKSILPELAFGETIGGLWDACDAYRVITHAFLLHHMVPTENYMTDIVIFTLLQVICEDIERAPAEGTVFIMGYIL